MTVFLGSIESKILCNHYNCKFYEGPGLSKGCFSCEYCTIDFLDDLNEGYLCNCKERIIEILEQDLNTVRSWI